MWVNDNILDLAWYVKSGGKLGEIKGRSAEHVGQPSARAELLLYGDAQAIRHLRIVIDVATHDENMAAFNANLSRWVSTLEVVSLMTTSQLASPARIQTNSASYVVTQFEGNEASDGMILNAQWAKPKSADLKSAADLMQQWLPDTNPHLHYLARFLNTNLPPEFRWLNGYRVLEWHFCRGKGKLPQVAAYRDLLIQHGGALDAHLRAKQDRKGLIEEVRALAAHAMTWDNQALPPVGGPTDPILSTFSALETLVRLVLVQLVKTGVAFDHPVVAMTSYNIRFGGYGLPPNVILPAPKPKT